MARKDKTTRKDMIFGRPPKEGEYIVSVQEKGVNESGIDSVKEGDVFYTVGVEEGEAYWDTASPFEAEVLSRLIRIGKELKTRKAYCDACGKPTHPLCSTCRKKVSKGLRLLSSRREK